ncbi:hypothetical protein FKZ61_018695 [Litorilinea aerophila]|uniref:Uncharacterized protein n=1 Tax=Litorilinea aerophila TaxID=1204385 RepID=A0A540VBE6_9CHLR|nr:hypothetical protein [Litorilinea aerophila]MCC9078131.1 hypothetical protein [Litorilinea aerophila]OUC09874.1 hypothetical protein RY27_00205 [Litorilinea aerophila]
MAERTSFIVRIWRDEQGILQGQIHHPQSGWRQPFHTAEQLWHLLSQFQDPEEPPGPPGQRAGSGR